MERKYIPTGWLGALVGTKLHIDFTKDTFDNQVAKLLREMTRLLGQNNEGIVKSIYNVPPGGGGA